MHGSGNGIVFTGLSAGYSLRRVLKDVAGDICPNERVAIIGPNASGKSTLLRALLGIVDATGEIQLDGQMIHGMPSNERSRSGLTYLPQTNNVFPTLTVEDNLEVSFRRSTELIFSERKDWLLTLFPSLRDRQRMRAGLLSGGERQVLALAMTLVNKPNVLLLDEPLAGLSEKAAREIIESLMNAQKHYAFGCAIIEHRFSLIESFATKVWIMSEGKIAHRSEGASVLSDEKLLSKYFF